VSAVVSEDATLVPAAAGDILDRAATELELRRQGRRLQGLVDERTAALTRATRELELFSYSVSHDLRAPLRSLDGFSQALIEDHADELDGEARDYLGRIRRAAQRMTAMLDGLLSLARVTGGPVGCEPVDLSALAEEIAARLQRTAPHRCVRFHIAAGMATQGDPDLLAVAARSLLGNAWKFTTGVTGAMIEVGETTLDGAPAWFVRDNGVGFDMANVDRLFSAFSRLHAEDQFPGLGIGLALVQRVVHRHGGRLVAVAAPGAGATFTFRLALTLPGAAYGPAT